MGLGGMLLRESGDLILQFDEVYNYFIMYHNEIIIEAKCNGLPLWLSW